MSFLLIYMSLLSCFGMEGEGLSAAEIKLLQSLNFQEALMLELKKESQQPFTQLWAVEAETGDFLDDPYPGIQMEIDRDRAPAIVHKLKRKFRQSGYLIFILTDDLRQPHIAVIKGTNELGILQYRRTNGINYGLEAEDVYARIANWKASYGLDIMGCGRDWVEVYFRNMPPDIRAFAKEVYAFCPDVIDQGVGTMKVLQQAIQDMGGIWLWWD